MSNVLLVGKLVSDRTQTKELYVDGSSELIFITHEHSKVHQGKLFTGGYYNASVANGNSIELLIQTSTPQVHLYLKSAAGGDSTFSIFEGGSINAAGTAVTAYNNNRASANTYLCTLTHTPNMSAYGTQLNDIEYEPGGTGGTAPGAVEQISTEQLVLAPSTNYVLRLTNTSGVAQPLNIRLGFYEVSF